MNKNDLIFDWSHTEVHRGWKGFSVLIAALGFGLVFSVISVQFDHRDIASVKSASVLFLPDHEEGKIWRMKAEEEGPYPGRLEISGLYDPLDDLGASLGDDSWNPYTVTMKPLEMDSAITAHRISAQGQRVFPRNFKSTEAAKEQPKAEVMLSPNLIPYTKQSEKWLPTELPVFRVEKMEEVAAEEWRFLLNLRADGTAIECLSLSGGDEEALAVITAWLKSLRFQKAPDAERWMGLRIEFLNERTHGSDSK